MKLHSALLISCFLILSGCLGAADSPPVYFDVHGEVVTTNGVPLLDKQIHIRNHFENIGFVENRSIEDEYILRFTASTQGVYTANLFRFQAVSPFITLFEDTLSAGDQELFIADSLLTNGIYEYEILNQTNVVSSGLFLVNKPDNDLPGTIPFTKTQANGEYTLAEAQLGLSRNFNFFVGGRLELTDSLQIIISDGEKIIKKEYVKVLPEQENFFEIIVDEDDI